mmetsp:Transcript_24703/g.62723  ORF Transcript_24703/g.62723 Transcript_24703/m.62723 type:complete len:300 (-) Transcript_24703:72-971(-)
MSDSGDIAGSAAASARGAGAMPAVTWRPAGMRPDSGVASNPAPAGSGAPAARCRFRSGSISEASLLGVSRLVSATCLHADTRLWSLRLIFSTAFSGLILLPGLICMTASIAVGAAGLLQGVGSSDRLMGTGTALLDLRPLRAKDAWLSTLATPGVDSWSSTESACLADSVFSPTRGDAMDLSTLVGRMTVGRIDCGSLEPPVLVSWPGDCSLRPGALRVASGVPAGVAAGAAAAAVPATAAAGARSGGKPMRGVPGSSSDAAPPLPNRALKLTSCAGEPWSLRLPSDEAGVLANMASPA